VTDRPLIAISEGFADYGDYYGYGYPRPVLAAGGMPVLLGYLEAEADRRELLERVGGLILAGGRDIEAWRYGRTEPHPMHLPGSPFLDEIELSYARMAVDAGVPLLGICRGSQILNVAFGGTLYGDATEFPGGGVDHPHAKWDEWRALVAATLAGEPRPLHPTHTVTIAPGSPLAEHLGETAIVDSYHHQGFDRIGEGLRPVAWAPDGVAEAIDMPGASTFVLGVQWELHEEWQDDAGSLDIFRTFVEAARARRAEREGTPVS